MRSLETGPQSTRRKTIDEILWNRGIRLLDGCLIWPGGGTPNGYGIIRLSNPRRNNYVHRFAYVWRYGEIPDGLVIDHSCKKRSCFEPSHLEAVTPAVNVQRALQKTHCFRGHDLAEWGKKYGPKSGRQCVLCSRIRSASKRTKAPQQP